MNLQPQVIIDARYIAAALLFIYGLKRMSSALTARSGIVVAGGGMYNPKTKEDLAKAVYFEKVDDVIICSGIYKEMWQDLL